MWEQNDRRRQRRGTALVNNTKAQRAAVPAVREAATVSPTGTLESPLAGRERMTTDPTRVFPDLAQILAEQHQRRHRGLPGRAAPPATAAGAAATRGLLLGVPADRRLGRRRRRPDPALPAHRPGRQPRRRRHRQRRRGADVAPAAGPFLVTSQATPAAHLGGGTTPVTWDVAGTRHRADQRERRCRISLSTDGGATFPYVLAERGPEHRRRDGDLPNVDTAQGRAEDRGGRQRLLRPERRRPRHHPGAGGDGHLHR